MPRFEEIEIVEGLHERNPERVCEGLSMLGETTHQYLRSLANSLVLSHLFGVRSGILSGETIDSQEFLRIRNPEFGRLCLFSHLYDRNLPSLPPKRKGAVHSSQVYAFDGDLRKIKLSPLTFLRFRLSAIFGGEMVTYFRICPEELNRERAWKERYPLLGNGVFMNIYLDNTDSSTKFSRALLNGLNISY